MEKTGDTSVFDVMVPYIDSPPLGEDEDERYEQPKISDEKETLLSHAIRAVDLVIKRGTGRHGLSLMGTGDWNDGMNLVGRRCRESVWHVQVFLSVTARKMAKF